MLCRISNEIVKYFQPNAVVIQCGADGLTGDELGGFNLTLKSFGFCLKQVLNWKKPTLILGGGNIYFSNFCNLLVLVFINILNVTNRWISYSQCCSLLDIFNVCCSGSYSFK